MNPIVFALKLLSIPLLVLPCAALGGNDSWGARTLDPYTNDGNKPYRYSSIMESAQ